MKKSCTLLIYMLFILTTAQGQVAGNLPSKTGKGNSIENSKSLTRILLVPAASSNSYISAKASQLVPGKYAIGPNASYPGYAGTYAKLLDVITAITAVPLTGNLIFEFQTGYDTSKETYPIVLPSNIMSSANATVTFRPSASVSSIINLSRNDVVMKNTGADYIIWDGRNGGTGTNQYLQFTNTVTASGVSTVILSNAALYNKFLYCILKGSAQDVSTGILTISDQTLGNNYYTIDHCCFNGNGAANNCLYTSGIATNAIITNNNFFDYKYGGINLANGSDNAVIDSNSLYQTTPYVGFTNMTTYGIIVTGGNNVIISNNNIGGSGPGLTGKWKVSDSHAYTYNFTGINATSLKTTSKIYNNKIQNFDWISNTCIWTGINASGSVNVGSDGANYIGNDSGVDNIKISYFANGNNQVNGIICNKEAVIENNIIGSITTLLNSGITTTGSNFTGISSTGTGLINHNTIGSSTISNSINMAAQSTTYSGNFQNVYGIYTSGFPARITNNTIANLNNGSKVNSGVTRGILILNPVSGVVVVTSNDIHSISTSQPVNALDVSSSLDGINIQSGTSAYATVACNTIYNLVNTSTGAICINGILFNPSTETSNKIERNYIHSFVTTSNTAIQNGININDGGANVQNNVIRLGIDKDGNSITSTAQINGILKSSSNVSNFYFNTIFIGGTGVIAGTVKSYAFNMSTKSTSVENVFNNIFVNMRSNLIADKLNYAISLPAISLPVMGKSIWMPDYNIYNVSETDGKLSSINGVDVLTTKALQDSYPNADVHSGMGDPLLAHATDALTTLDLKPLNTTPAEATGKVISGINDDYTGSLRNNNTPTDIGAYSGNFSPALPEQDIFAPTINYNSLGNASSTTSRLTVNFATITDKNAGVNVAPGTKPRLYYKIKLMNANAFVGNTSSDNGWKWVESTGITSPFDFNIDYRLLYGPIALGTVIEYFVVAQDLASQPFITFVPALGASGTSVTPEGMKAPAMPNVYTIVASIPPTINVGDGQTYTTLTGVGGVFATINAGSINANTIVTIKSNLSEPGTNSLKQVNEDGPNAGALTLTIQSDGSSHFIFGANVTAYSPMIPITGAKRLTIDGGDGKVGKLLTFRNTNSTSTSTGPVFEFYNSSQNDTLKNCIIESNCTSVNTPATTGAIRIGNAGPNSVTILQNDIRDARGLTKGSPMVGIYSQSLDNTLNIINNNIYNLTNSNSFGIYLYQVADGCSIIGNSIYMESEFSAVSVSPFTGIYFYASSNHIIKGNFIGGSAPNCGGSLPYTISGAGTFNGIFTNYTATPEVIIQGNTIQNIKMTSTLTPLFYGINNKTGPIIIIGNTIGSATTANSIQIAGTATSTSSGIIQSDNMNVDSCTIEKNVIANITLTNAKGSPTFSALKTNGGSVNMNTIFNIGSSVAALTPFIYGINNTNGISVNEFSNNVISLNGGASTSPTLYGFYEGSTIGSTEVYYNSINLYGTATGSNNSFAFNRSADNNYTVNNNIFVNTRTGSGVHYALYSSSITGLNSNFNDLYVSGTTLGHWGLSLSGIDINNLVGWKTTTLQDVNSVNVDPLFSSNTNLLPLDTSPVLGLGIPVTGIITDIANRLRNITLPSLGAYELACIEPTNGGAIGDSQTIWDSSTPALLTNTVSASVNSGTLEYKWQSSVSPFNLWNDIAASNVLSYKPSVILETTAYKRLARTACMKSWIGAAESNIVTITLDTNKWKGTYSNDWNEARNWTQNKIPATDANIIFDNVALTDCKLNSDLSVNDITSRNSIYHFITNGNILSVKGKLNLTMGAQVDASAANSDIVFSGAKPQTIPSGIFVNDKVYNLTIDNAFGVTLNTDLTVSKLLTINQGKQLIIPTGMLLNVEGNINNLSGNSGLIIKTDPLGAYPNGSLIFHNNSQDPIVPATVEMFTKAARSDIDGLYKWQFFGIPLTSVQANPTFYGSYVREMHEDVIGTTGRWVQLQNESVLKSFTGYEITQADSKVITFEGNLENADYSSGQLSFTSGATYMGQHLIGNPYTAAINISNIVFGSTNSGIIENSVYLYNTGSLADWALNGNTSVNESANPGQYVVVPKMLADRGTNLPSQIPSMQAFLVSAVSDNVLATVSIPYSAAGTVECNTTKQRAKAVRSVSTQIDVKGTTYGDRMWIFTEPTCTRGFDNGWDGYKMIGSILAPQIYAMEQDGDYQVNTVEDINNTNLGFRAGIDTSYTMTFVHQNIDSRYQRIYLMDLSENRTADITTSGSKYSFTSNSIFPIENRFKIIAKTDGTDITTSGIATHNRYNALKIFSSKNTVIVNNQTNLKGNLYLYDLAGRCILKLSFNENVITTFPIQLPVGSYVAKAVTLIDEVTTHLILMGE